MAAACIDMSFLENPGQFNRKCAVTPASAWQKATRNAPPCRIERLQLWALILLLLVEVYIFGFPFGEVVWQYSCTVPGVYVSV
eukprot:3777172-Amphidinium_carterae.1